MMYRTFADLGVWPPQAVVKVDDTVPGLVEGLAAGCWTVGIAASGNECGLSLAEWTALDPAAREAALVAPREKLMHGGAHYVVDTVADLLPVIDDIEQKLQRGIGPGPAMPNDGN